MDTAKRKSSLHVDREEEGETQKNPAAKEVCDCTELLTM
jgi:hypothetical protein